MLFKRVGIFLFLACMISAGASAQSRDRNQSPVLGIGQGLEMNRSDLAKMRNNKQEKNSEQTDVYMFAVAFSLIDSVMYTSDIQKMEAETLNNHWFLKNREGYENQFSAFVTGGDDETTVTFLYFSEEEKRAVRKLATLVKRNSKTNRFPIIGTGEEFRFTPIVEL